MWALKIQIKDMLGYLSSESQMIQRLMTINYLTIVILLCIAIINVTIIINQRKLKKQIRHLEDLLQQQTGQAEQTEQDP